MSNNFESAGFYYWFHFYFWEIVFGLYEIMANWEDNGNK